MNSAETSDLLVRHSRVADLASLAAIYGHHVATGIASFETDPPDPAEMERRHAELIARGMPYFVAEEAGQVLGFAYAGPYRTRAAYRNTVEDSVYLRPDAQRRGIGRRLLTTLVAECGARGFRQMMAVVGDGENIASIGLHESCGFRRVGFLEGIGFKFDRWRDVVLMQRSLGPGNQAPPERG